MTQPARALQDFLFGQYATVERTFEIERQKRRGIHHANRIIPANPRPGDLVTVHIQVGPQIPADRLFVVYTTDGDPIAHSPHEVQRGQLVEATLHKVEWDTLIWGYVHHYRAHLPAQPEGCRVSYQIFAWSEQTEQAFFADSADRYTEATRFVYCPDHHGVPAWTRDAIFYHIFLDRFHPGRGKHFPESLALDDIWGGTLDGVRNSLPYLEELGVTALWLSPCYPSPSHHGYDVCDLRSINPRMGSMEEMKALVRACHQKGMRVLLDFTPNHLSKDHDIFQQAISDPDSRYRDWFYFRDWPTSYEAFFDLPSLPKINTSNPAARRYLIESALFWLEETGVDGFRMDHAHGPPMAFWSDYRSAIKRRFPDSLTLGEITETARFVRQYEGCLDGVLDFIWAQEARRFFIFDAVDAHAFDRFLRDHDQYFAGRDLLLPTFLDNHDMNRFLWSAEGDTRRLKLAALCQFTQSGPPIIYYGTEVGVTQERDVQQGAFAILEESRTPMRWGNDQNRELLNFYRRLIAFRRRHPASYRGSRITLHTGHEGALAYARCAAGELVIAALNNSDQEQKLELSLEALPAADRFMDLDGHPVYPDAQHLNLTLPPRAGTLLAGTVRSS